MYSEGIPKTEARWDKSKGATREGTATSVGVVTEGFRQKMEEKRRKEKGKRIQRKEIHVSNEELGRGI